MSTRTRLAAVVLAGLTLGACSTVPTSSPTVPITQVPPRQDAEVAIEPLAPEPGASPEEIVRNFIDASASTGRGHPVAREHLTPEAADEWADDAGVTVIEPGFSTVTREEGVVRVTARRVGRVDQRGVFTVDDQTFARDYSVERVDDEWRIANPPDGLVILEPDFSRVYDRLNAYFLDPTGRRIVPDPRYLVDGEAQPTALVQRLFEGPSPTLRSAVDNALSGLSLRRPVGVDGSAATVDLTGLDADPEVAALEQISAQLVWTLEQADIRSVEVLVEGEAVRLPQRPRAQTTSDWASYDPDAMPVDAVGHYVDGGALRTTPEGEPVPGPAGEGAYRLTSAAVATDPTSGELSYLVGVSAPREDGFRELFAGPYGGALERVQRNGRTFTPPTVAATRAEVWTVRNGTAVVRVARSVAPQSVSAPALAELGTVRQLQLSPDGVRAALVVERGSGPALFMATVVRDDESAVTLRDPEEVNPVLDDPVDVAWRAADTLLVLAADESGNGTVPWEVGVDGWAPTEIATSGLPGDATAVAAAPTREPLVSAGDRGEETIWRLIGGTWETLVEGLPPQPGTEPFFPR